MAKTRHIRQPIDVTYSELVTLINSSGLTEGQEYRITDYQTVHYIIYGGGDINSGSTEILIATAISENEISPVVKSELYPQDEIFYDWNPENWLSDDGFSSNSVIIPNFKGVIYKRHDKKNNNLLWYDFRNVKFRRWETNIIPVGHSTKFVAPQDWYYDPGYDFTFPDIGTITVPDTESYEDFLTFNCTNEQTYENTVFNNIFSSDIKNYTILSNNVFHITENTISDNIFGQGCKENTFSYAIIGNIISQGFEFNIIGNNFYSNIIGSYFYWNYIKERVYSNTIGGSWLYENIFDRINGCSFGDESGLNKYENCENTAFGGLHYDNLIQSTYSSYIGSEWFENIVTANYSTLGTMWAENNINGSYSTIGSEIFECIIPNVEYSTLGNQINELNVTDEIYGCTIGSEFYNNTFFSIEYSNIGSQWYNNTFGRFYANTAGNVFYNNVMQESYSNNIGNSFVRNTIGNTFSFNTIKNDTAYLNIPENFRGNTINNEVAGTFSIPLNISPSIPGITDRYTNVEIYLGNSNMKRAKLHDSLNNLVIYDVVSGELLKTIGDDGGIINVTYSELVTLINSSGLTSGQYYKITDYQTVHTIPKTTDTNTSEIEPLIVTALSSTELKPEAYSENHPGDVIYYNIENDTSKVPGCTKGYIYRRIDTLQNNDFPFDFRNVKFRRWQISVPVWDSSTTYSIGDYMTRPSTNEVYMSMVENNINLPYNTARIWKRFEFDNLSYISPTPDSWERDTNWNYSNELPCSSLYEDYNFYSNPTYYLTSFNNKICSTDSTTDILSYYNSVVFGINFSNNNIKSNFYENSIKNSFHKNNIGTNFYNNSTGDGFYQNLISNYFNNNSIGVNFDTNTIGEWFAANIIGNDFINNNIGHSFDYNILRDSFEGNNISQYFELNIISDTFVSNVIGNWFFNNKIGRGFEDNVIGNWFENNASIGNFFSWNTIGNYFDSNISIGDRFMDNTIGTCFAYDNIIGNYFTGNSAGNYFCGNTIGNYFQYNTIGNGIYNLITPDKTSATSFIYNTLKDGIGDNFVTTDFTGATHVFEKYHCDIFVIFGGSIKLSYFDENGALVVVDANS